MPFGENVGTAYVRILADGAGLDESIRQQFQGADGAFDESGRRGSDRYAKSFEKEMKKSPNEKRLQNSITDALAKGDFLSKGFLHGPAWQGFKQDLENEFGDAGKLAGERLERDMVNGMTFDQLKGKLQNIQPLITKAQDDILKNDRQFIRDRNAAYEEHRRRMSKIVQDLNKEFEKVSQNIDLFGKGDKGAPNREQLVNDLQRIGREMHSAGGHTDEFARALKNQEDRLRHIHPNLSRFDGAMGRLSDNVGRAFGKGSRNNFFNFIGSFAGGLVGLLRVVPRLAQAFDVVKNAVGNIIGVMQEAAQGGAGGLQVALAGVKAAAADAGPALVGFAAIAVGAMFLIGPLVAILSGLVGILAALASTIVFGAVGALAVLAGAVVPLVAIFGGLELAFHAMTKAQKTALHDSLVPLTKGFRDMATAIRDPIMNKLPGQLQRLSPVLKDLHPMFHQLGVEISNIGTQFLNAMNSPGFKNFSGAFQTFLPDAVRSMGHIIGNVLGGLGGLFVGLIPQTNSFLGWLQKITGEFAKWANSDKGRQSLLDFFKRAGDSAQSLGNFLLAAGGFLTTLLSQGQGTGNNIFDSMTSSIKDATKWMQDHPDAVNKWFGNAQKLAGDIGGISVAILAIADAFDNANTRVAADTALTAALLVLEGAGLVIQGDATLINAALHGIVGMFGIFAGGVRKAAGIVTGIVDNIKKALQGLSAPHLSGGGGLIIDARSLAGGMVRAFANVVPRIVGALQGLPKRVGGVFSRIGPVARAIIPLLIRPFAPVAGRIGSAISGIPGRVRGIFNRLPGIARGVIGGITRPFGPVAGRIMGLLSPIPGRVNGLLHRLPGIAHSAASATGSAFSGVTGRIMGLLSPIPGRVGGLLGRLGGIASRAASAVAHGFAGITGRIASQFSGVGGAVAGRLAGLAGAARAAASAVVGAFAGLAGRIISAVGTIQLPTPHISMPHIPSIHIPGTAIGGVFEGLRGVGVIRQIGEAGAEAVVPLNRSLSQVDPSVRMLSAIAQGKVLPGMANGGVVGSGKTVDVGGINVYTVTQDPRAVAAEVFNRFAATAY